MLVIPAQTLSSSWLSKLWPGEEPYQVQEEENHLVPGQGCRQSGLFVHSQMRWFDFDCVTQSSLTKDGPPATQVHYLIYRIFWASSLEVELINVWLWHKQLRFVSELRLWIFTYEEWNAMFIGNKYEMESHVEDSMKWMKSHIEGNVKWMKSHVEGSMKWMKSHFADSVKWMKSHDEVSIKWMKSHVEISMKRMKSHVEDSVK